jgi:hypothetical protein
VADQGRADLRMVKELYRHLIDRSLGLDAELGAAYLGRAMWGDESYD